ncbi:MAG: hypothetical protein DRN30_04720 [Thermoplasmata archaeon]|nr:hypothetical protein [Euryarchaeota archaeon]RLF65018.1 MAG: hypothetical protein DRN30_04720 [Thermoplasmata archaeon]
MNIVLVMCRRDVASVNIGEHIIDMTKPKSASQFNNEPVYEIFENVLMVTIDKDHIFYNDLDKEISRTLGITPDILVFLSRHSSATKIRTLTVHPVGNYNENPYGGLPRTLVYAEPYLMSETLRHLYKKSKDLDYRCSYEVTHHGPYVSSRTFFIEIGSSEEAWKDKDAGSAVASALVDALESFLDGRHSKKRPMVGVGGGHYAPRFTSYALDGFNFGHMVPEHSMNLDSILMALRFTPDVESVGIHWKGSNEKYLEIYKKLEERGIHVKKLK